jgi:hypothetical protein
MGAVKVAFAFFVGVLVLTPEAWAIDPGVIYEPGSPAGKEYALPLEEARREAGSPGSGEGANPSYEAFGVGTGPADKRREQSDRGDNRDRDGKRAGEADDVGERGGVAVSRAGLADAEAAGGSFGWSMLIILAVLIPGVLLGFGLGRLPRGGAGGHAPRNTSASRGAHRSTE